MKPEARILLTLCCRGGPCIGLILRAAGIDGAVAGKDCASLCSEFVARGFRGETRYSRGDCTCGLPEPPLWRPEWEGYAVALAEGCDWLKHYKPLLLSSPRQGDQ